MYIARAQLRINYTLLNYKVSINAFSELSLAFYCCIYIYHQNNNNYNKNFGFRSYNPTGILPYLNYSQFLFTLKLSSTIIKAAISGA